MNADWLTASVVDLGETFLDPRKRVFWGYLISAALVTMLWGAFANPADRFSGARGALRSLFSRRAWCSRSAVGDYKLILANAIVMRLVAPALVSRVALAAAFYFLLQDWLGHRYGGMEHVAPWLVPVAFTLFQFLLDDGSRYLLHRALHRFPVLWSFHQVHHSAQTLSPITVLRSHPVEGVAFALRASLVQAAAIALFVSLFGDAVGLLTVFGVQVFLFLFNLLGSNLRHSPVAIRYGRLESWLISPAQHQLHHSVKPEHIDKNFGSVLAVWDRLGGTWLASSAEDSVVYGLASDSRFNDHDLKTLYLTPVGDALATCATMAKTLYGGLRMVTPPSTRFARSGLLCVLSLMLLLGTPLPASAASTLNIYSHRQPFLINPFLDAFRAKTGAEVNVVFASKGLAQRLQAEGERSPADVVLTVDIGRLHVYADKDLLAPIESAILSENIPSHLRDPENRWFAFSTRARVIAYSKSRVAPSEIERIEDLAEDRWKGRICSRPGSHVYNRALLSSIIAANGEQAAEAWARGLVENLAQRPQGNDRAQIKAIFEGVCDLALVNSYYFGMLKHSDVPEQREWVEDVGILFTNQADRGNHINISGGGVAKHSKNKETAIAFLEFLTMAQAQRLYGEINYEFPVNPDAIAGAEVRSWGEFVADELPIGRIAELAPTAQRIIDRVGW